MNTAKIIMYHYVRPIKESKFPEIKGLETDKFLKQLAYFEKNFKFGGINYLLDSINSKQNSKLEKIVLTFDDGLKDHFKHVFPILKEKNIQGLFFPPAKPIIENKVLDVHKIQFILAVVKDKSLLVKEIMEKINEYRKEADIDDTQSLWKKLATSSRFDSAETMFVKRILQRELPNDIKTNITKELFQKYVCNNENDFSKQLYLSFDEIKEMRENGMYFSSHSYSHEWLSFLSSEKLEDEIKKSREFAEKINPKGEQIMCYPYGDYDTKVIEKISENNFRVGLTTKIGDAELSIKNRYHLERFDTNDFIQ